MQELMAEGLSNGALHGSAVQNLLLETLSIVLRLSVSISAVDTRLQFGAAVQFNVERNATGNPQLPPVRKTSQAQTSNLRICGGIKLPQQSSCSGSSEIVRPDKARREGRHGLP